MHPNSATIAYRPLMWLVVLFALTVHCPGRLSAVFVNFTGRATDSSHIRVRILRDQFSTQRRLAWSQSLWDRFECSLVELDACPAYPHCLRLPQFTWGPLSDERDSFWRTCLASGSRLRQVWSQQRSERLNEINVCMYVCSYYARSYKIVRMVARMIANIGRTS